MARLVAAFGSSPRIMLASQREDSQHRFQQIDPKHPYYYAHHPNTTHSAALLPPPAPVRDTRQNTASNPDIYAPQYIRIKEQFSHDVSVSYDVTDQFQLYGGVNNLFDQKPAIGMFNTPVSAVGRFMFVGAKVKLANLFGGK